MHRLAHGIFWGNDLPGVLSTSTLRGDLANFVGLPLNEPEGAARSSGDADRITLAGRDGVLGERSGEGDAPNLVAKGLGEPEIAVRSLLDIRGEAGSGGHRE